MMIFLKTTWNANAGAKIKETNESLGANSTSIDMEANRGATLGTKMELIANVSADGVQGKNISSSRRVEAYEGLDLMLTFVTESYPPVSSQRWSKPAKVRNNANVTMYQESYSADRTR